MRDELIKKIAAQQEKLLQVAGKKANPLQDPECYQISCQLDKLIVQLMKLQKNP